MQSKRNSTVDVLKDLPGILTTADVRKFAGDSNMFLYRASKKGYIEKIANGVYANVLFGRKPSVEQVDRLNAGRAFEHREHSGVA